MRTRTPAPTCSSLIVAGLSAPAVEKRETLFEVERGRDAFEREPQLHHREGDFGLNPHNDGFSTAKLGRIGESAERAGRERIEDVQGGDVDDDTASAVTADQVGQVVPEL